MLFVVNVILFMNWHLVCKPFGQLVAKPCIHINFPSHPIHAKRKECGAPLLQKVCRSGHTCFQPIKVYMYYPIKTTLTRLFNHKEFFSLCERWRTRHASSEYMGDIYDGWIWEEWQSWNGHDFLAASYSLAATLNLDWFQPFSLDSTFQTLIDPMLTTLWV